MIRILIIEDESLAARNLERILSQVSYSNIIVAKLESVKEVVSVYPTLLVDLIFMDIHLLDGNAFQIFKHIEIRTPIIFTTAFDNYAIEAFNHNSIHYLLKPIYLQKVESALQKYSDYSNSKSTQNEVNYSSLLDIFDRKSYKKKFLVQVGKKMLPIATEDIAYFFVDNKSIYFMITEGNSYLTDYSLSQVESFMDPDLFYRVNRQFLVNVNAVKSIYYESTSRLRLDTNPPFKFDILVSIDKIVKFKKWLDR